MTLRDHVAALVDALPAEASVTLPAATLRSWLEDDLPGFRTERRALADLAIEDVAEALRIKLSRARQLVRENAEVMGAYQRGRRWYVPHAGLRAFQEDQAAAYRAQSSAKKPANATRGGEVDFTRLRASLRSRKRRAEITARGA